MSQIQRAHAPRHRLGERIFNGVLFFMALLFAAVALAGMAVVLYFEQSVEPHFEQSMQGAPALAGASHIYYYEFEDRSLRQGQRVALERGTLDGGVHYIPTSYADYPRALVDAFVAIEDKRFFEHHGVDFLRTGEAAINYFITHDGRFGASTITQQLVKNLSGRNENTIHRKLQEMVWANDLENRCTKQQIMERYLNIIPLSQGCYGVGAAAERFFGKAVSELSVGECAALAGITQNPSYYDPVRFAEHTLARRKVILAEMLCQGYLDQESYDAAHEEALTLKEGAGRPKTPVYSWYVDMLMEDVVSDLCAQYGYTREYANQLLWSGGLTIEAAIDPTVQSRLEAYYADPAHFPVHKSGERAQSGMIVIDVATGDILGVVGAVGDKSGNRLQSRATTTLRPAASAIKPLSVYAPALERGLITWASVFDDVPVTYHTGASGKKTVAWPKNANRVYRGLTDVRYAVAQSVNTVAVRVLHELGRENSFRFLRDTLGMHHLLEQKTLEDGRVLSDCGDAALALGQMNYGVTLRELTAGYSALANGGVYLEPHSYFRVLGPDGEVLLSHTVEGRYAVSEQNAAIMTKLLQNVVTQGTGKGASLLGGKVDVAGKTGTSSADCDRYFIGYTPQYLAGVWYGFDYPAPLSDIKSNQAVRIFREVMQGVVGADVRAGKAKTRFDLPEGIIRVTYCRDSGLLPTAACRADLRGDRCSEGYFVQGSEPKRFCSCHVMREYDAERGVLADGATLPEARRKVGFLNYRRRLERKTHVLDERYMVGSMIVG